MVTSGTPTHPAALRSAAGSRMYLVIHYVTYVGIVAHASFIGLFAWLHLPLLAVFNVYSVAAWVAARIANRRRYPTLALCLLSTEVVGHAVLATSLLGWNSGFDLYLWPVIPFLMFHDQLRTRFAVLGSLAVGAIDLALRITTFQGEHLPLPFWVPYLNIVIPLLALGVISVYFRFASIDVERRMEQLAMTDSLTRLPNRRSMRDSLELEAARFARHGTRYSVVLADIDGFKNINDSSGHEAGDQALRALANALRATLRAQDQVARWGGEEFLCLLPQTELREAGIVAERLRAAVEELNFAVAGQTISATMTFGVATAEKASSGEDCVRRADRALYLGKEQGKNRVVLEAKTEQAA
jgi:diguanylate cyclase (GGDEF)-like protein